MIVKKFLYMKDVKLVRTNFLKSLSIETETTSNVIK